MKCMLRNKIFLIGILGLALFLRLYNFGGNPSSLYWEEVALGYDAYSILKTGADHHGHFLPIVALESFGDWKPALYAYAIIPFIPLFDLGAIAVRLPSLLAGLSLLFALYLIAKKLGQNPLLVLAITAISPWAIQFSRVGWEAHLATACITWGLYFGIATVGEKKKIQIRHFALSVFFLILSLYTYHAARIVAPVVGLSIILFITSSLGFKSVLGTWKKMLFIILLAFVAVVPLLAKISSPEILQRSRETSIFSDVSIILESNQLKEQARNSLLSRLIYHRYVLFSQEIIKNGLAQFTPRYLFLSGDPQIRHSVQFFGHLYHIEAIFLILGFFVWLKKRTKLHLLLFFVAILSVLPAAISTGSPHALRSMTLFPILMLLAAEGIQMILSLVRARKLLFTAVVVLIVGAYTAELSAFWLYYNDIYPKVAASEWQYGYAEMVQSLEQKMQENPDLPVYVSRAMGRPAMYYWFYTKTDPRLVQAANATAKKDQGEFLEFGGIEFVNSESELPQDDSPKIVASPITGENSWTIEVR